MLVVVIQHFSNWKGEFGGRRCGWWRGRWKRRRIGWHHMLDKQVHPPREPFGFEGVRVIRDDLIGVIGVCVRDWK